MFSSLSSKQQQMLIAFVLGVLTVIVVVAATQ
jgi:hypothetical protein